MASVAELRARVEELEKKHENLTMENEMLADYLLRHSQGAAEEGVVASGGKKGGKAAKQQTLTLDERFKIANGEVETLNKDIEQTKKASDQNLGKTE